MLSKINTTEGLAGDSAALSREDLIIGSKLEHVLYPTILSCTFLMMVHDLTSPLRKIFNSNFFSHDESYEVLLID